MSSYIPKMPDLQEHWDRWVVWGSAVTEDVVRRVEAFPRSWERFEIRRVGPSGRAQTTATTHVAEGASRFVRSTTAALLKNIACASLLTAAAGTLTACAIIRLSRPPTRKAAGSASASATTAAAAATVPWPATWAPAFEARDSLLFTVLAWGHLEDAVEPTLTLALELKACGHRVRICLRQEHVDFARRAGLVDEDLVPITVGSSVDSVLLEAKTRVRSFFPGLSHYYNGITAHVFAALWSASEGADVLIGQISPLVSELSYLVAKKRQIPFFYAAHEPLLVPSARARVSSGTPGEMPLLRYQLLNFSLGAAARDALKPVYRQLGLRRSLLPQCLPLTSDFWALPVLASFPTTLFPSPSGHATHVQLGPWIASDTITDLTASTPDPDLHAFLKQDDKQPPLLVSFGRWSATLVAGKRKTKAAFTSMLFTMLQASGCTRAIIDGELVDPAVPVPDGLDVFFLLGEGDLTSEKRAWLLAQCRAAVIPGDSSLVLAALRAAVPVVVVPQTKLQISWSQAVEQRGVGRALEPSCLLSRCMWEEVLADVLSPATRTRVALLAGVLGSECQGGVGRAVEAIHDSLAALHAANKKVQGERDSALATVRAAWRQRSKGGERE